MYGNQKTVCKTIKISSFRFTSKFPFPSHEIKIHIHHVLDHVWVETWASVQTLSELIEQTTFVRVLMLGARGEGRTNFQTLRES